LLVRTLSSRIQALYGHSLQCTLGPVGYVWSKESVFSYVTTMQSDACICSHKQIKKFVFMIHSHIHFVDHIYKLQ
jgi:hypothetical protein